VGYLIVARQLEIRRLKFYKQKITNKEVEKNIKANGKPTLKFERSINPN
jgi:hypothetical protein